MSYKERKFQSEKGRHCKSQSERHHGPSLNPRGDRLQLEHPLGGVRMQAWEKSRGRLLRNTGALTGTKGGTADEGH